MDTKSIGAIESDNGPADDKSLLAKPRNRLPADNDSKPDPYDLESLRLKGGQRDNVKRVLTVVPCRKPNKVEFVRVHPDYNYELETCIFEDKIGQATYLVAEDMRCEFVDSTMRNVRLHLAINRQKGVFLWPVTLPGADGKTNPWNESSAAAANLAKTKWIRLSANMAAGCYDVFEATGNLSEPEWPDITFQDAIRLSFKNRLVDDPDHAVLQGLRGEI